MILMFFFCDTEGIESLDSIQKTTIPGILTLLQICNISVYMLHKFCSGNDFKEIYSQIQLSKILPKNLVPNPRITIYVSSIFIGNDNENNSDIKDSEESLNYKNVKEKYKESENFLKKKIFDEFKKNPNLNVKDYDFDVIGGGPYPSNKYNKEPNHEDINAQLYWDSIHEILKIFVNETKKEKEYKNKINLIKCLFEIFSEIKKIDDNFCLDKFLKEYLSKKFDENSNKQFMMKVNKLKVELKTNFVYYINILNDDNKGKEFIIDCIDKDYIEIYNKLIYDKMNNFIKLYL